MIVLPTSWLYKSDKYRKLVRLKTLEDDSLIHSILECLFSKYRGMKLPQDKQVYASKFKSSLVRYNEEYNLLIRKHKDNEFLEKLSKDFEVNIYLFRCYPDDTLIQNKFLHSVESPTILIEQCGKYHPLGIEDKQGIHMLLFGTQDDEVVSSIEAFDKSGLSDNYEEKPLDEFIVDDSFLVKYDVEKLFKA